MTVHELTEALSLTPSIWPSPTARFPAATPETC